MKETLRDIRRTLHRCPETGTDLPVTKKTVTQIMERYGIGLEETAGSLTALIGDPEKGETVLLRADMDALPLREESGEEFASENGNCHACGHDLHTAMLIGAAAILKKAEKDMKGAVRLLFQSAEETAEGAKAFAGSGILEDPHISAAYALHVQPEMRSGYINGTPGWKMKGYDRFRIKVTGKGGHGGKPHMTKDPIRTSVYIYQAIDGLMAHTADPAGGAVISIGEFHAGTSANIIPGEAEMSGTIRTMTADDRIMMREKLSDICRAAEKMSGTSVSLVFEAETQPLWNDKELTGRAVELLKRNGLDASADPEPSAFSEDFAEIAAKVPSVYLHVGAKKEGDPVRFNHDPRARYDEEILPAGTAALALMAADHIFLK